MAKTNKLYSVTVTSRKGRIWRYHVEGTGKFSAKVAAQHVKKTNGYKGKTEVIEMLIPPKESIDILKSLKPLSSDNFPESRIFNIKTCIDNIISDNVV